MAPPAIAIEKPEKFVGDVEPARRSRISAPDAPTMKPIRVVFEQNGKQTTLFSLDEPGKAKITQEGTDKVRITHEIGKQTVPDLQSGAARIIVTAGRPVLRGMRTLAIDREPRRPGPAGTAARVGHLDAPLRQSRRHGVHRLSRHAGRCRVGRRRRRRRVPGIPGVGRDVDGVKITDPAIRVAFFALLYDQDLNTPMRVYARDPAGNTARADFDHRTFPKPFKKRLIRD